MELPSLPYPKFDKNLLARNLYFETPLEFAIGRNMKIYEKGEQIGRLDQRNFTFLIEHIIYSGKKGQSEEKKQYFVDQKFHLFRRVYEIHRLNSGEISMAEAVLATIILDRMYLADQ